VAAVLVLAGCQVEPPTAKDEPATSFAFVTATDFSEAFRDKNDWTWSGGDLAASYRASNGQTYWMFGDSVVGEEDPVSGGYRDGWRLLPNTILRQGPAGLTIAIAGLAIPSAVDGDRYWAMAMFETSSSLYVLAQRVRNTSNYFELRGVELAKFAIRADGGLDFAGMVATPSTGVVGGARPASAQYGLDAVVVDGYAYVFGLTTDPANAASPQQTYVARVPATQVETPSAWRFWTAAGWSRRMDQAVPILPAQLGSARYLAGRWVLAYKPWNCWGGTVSIEQRRQLAGPAVTTTSLPSPGGAHYVTYAPQLHPEQALKSGDLLVSVSYTGRSLTDLAHDADLYKPRFFEVELPSLTSSTAAVYPWPPLSSGRSLLCNG
jgi:hypothetical protein